MSKKRFPKYSGEELSAFRTDPKREDALGITEYVVCRECGEGHALITALHLLKPGHTVKDGAKYQAKWKGAPLRSEAAILADAKRREASEQMWKDPEQRKQIIKAQNERLITPAEKRARAAHFRGVWDDPEKRKEVTAKIAAAQRTPEARARMSVSVREAQARPEVRKAISEGTKKGLAPARVRRKISRGLKRNWRGNTARREATRQRTKARWDAQKALIKEAERIRAERGQKPGPRPNVTLVGQVEELYEQSIKWPKIKEIMDGRTGVYRSIDAYRMLLKRHRDMKERTN